MNVKRFISIALDLAVLCGALAVAAKAQTPVNVAWRYDASKWPVTTPAMTRTFEVGRTVANAGAACPALASATTWVQVVTALPATQLQHSDANVITFNSYCYRVRAIGTWPALGAVPAGSANTVWAYSATAVTVLPTIPPPTGVDAQVPQAVADVKIDFNGQTVATLKLAVPPKQGQPVAEAVKPFYDFDGTWFYAALAPNAKPVKEPKP